MADGDDIAAQAAVSAEGAASSANSAAGEAVSAAISAHEAVEEAQQIVAEAEVAASAQVVNAAEAGVAAAEAGAALAHVNAARTIADYEEDLSWLRLTVTTQAAELQILREAQVTSNDLLAQLGANLLALEERLIPPNSPEASEAQTLVTVETLQNGEAENPAPETPPQKARRRILM